MNRSEQINEIAAALAKAQGEIKPAKFDATNPHFKSKYATLASIQEACRDPLSKNGLAVVQGIQVLENDVVLQTMLVHTSGQWLSSDMRLVMEQVTMQKMGSALTYARRYSLAALVGVVADEDDDGNAASEGAGDFKRDPSTFRSGSGPNQAPTTTAGAKPKPKDGPKKPPNQAPMSESEFAKTYMAMPSNAGEYVTKFGKFQGQMIKDIGQVELGGYCEFIYQNAKKDNKEITGLVKEFLMAAEFYLSQF